MRKIVDVFLNDSPRASNSVVIEGIPPLPRTEMPQPFFEPTAAQPADSSLVGGATADSATSAFAQLNQVVEDSVPPPAAHDPGPVVSGKTVEDMVKEMLRLMLKEWLDHNLPQMVERLVEREIVRLTRR
jgi:cell pole-organizing protein PopZ